MLDGTAVCFEGHKKNTQLQIFQFSNRHMFSYLSIWCACDWDRETSKERVKDN